MLNLLLTALKIRNFFSFQTAESREQFDALFVFEDLLLRLEAFIIYGHGTEKWRSIWSIFIITNTMHTIGVDKITLFKTT